MRPRKSGQMVLVFLLLAVVEGYGASAASAQDKNGSFYTPKPGSLERRAIADTLRQRVRVDLKKPVIFKIRTLRVQGDWAFIDCTPLQPNGKPVNYKGTRFQQAVQNDAFSGIVVALLHRQGNLWKITALDFGLTDVSWTPWAKQYHAPPAIFPKG